MTREEEKQLLERLKNDFPDAFKELVDLHRNRVLNVCYCFLHNRADAEDVAQDVFVEVYRSLPEFRGEAQLSTWIYRIAVTKSLDLIRRQNRKKRFGIFHAPLRMEATVEQVPAPRSFNPTARLEDHERSRILQQAVNSLPENQKTAITLRKYEGVSYQEIADIMGTTVSSVESLIHRGMGNLRKKLYRYYRRIL